MEADVGLGKYVSFLKFSKINHRVTSLRKIQAKAGQNFYEKSFFPSTTIEWNNLSQYLRNKESCILFRCSILKLIRPSPNSFYDCQNIMGKKLVKRLCLGLSHLRKHKFIQSYQDTLKHFCKYGMDVESSAHFLLKCPPYINKRPILMSDLSRINQKISQNSLQLLTNISYFGNSFYRKKMNTIFLKLLWTTCN